MLDTIGKPEPDPMAPKGWAHSRTIIFNAIAAFLTVAYGIAQVVSQNPAGLDPRVITVAGLIVTVGNLYLRMGTTAPIAGTSAATRVQAAKETIALNAAVQVAGPSVTTSSTQVVGHTDLTSPSVTTVWPPPPEA
jgi:hypothetical protein